MERQARETVLSHAYTITQINQILEFAFVGDAYGQGKVRSKELTAAAALLGIPQENCDVVNDE